MGRNGRTLQNRPILLHLQHRLIYFDAILVANDFVSELDLFVKSLHIRQLHVFTFIHTVDGHALPSSGE